MSLECPFCGAEDEDCVLDAWEYELNTSHEAECDNCEKTFILYGEPEINWNSSKPECGDHSFDGAIRFDYYGEFSIWSKSCEICEKHEVTSRLPLYSEKPEDF